MSDMGALALRLSEATDIPTAAERLAEYLRSLAPRAAARVYLLGPGDNCSTCPRAAQCGSRDRCFHLEGSVGSFSRPVMLDQRIPRTLIANEIDIWGAVFSGQTEPGPASVPPELSGQESENETALLVPLEAGGEVVGVAGLRITGDAVPVDEVLADAALADGVPAGAAEAAAEGESEAEKSGRLQAALDARLADAQVAAFLTATAVRLVRSLSTANRRFEQLLLVNELGRKVNAILNDELLLRQATVDIHRTFGFHNVMIFMLDDERKNLELKAQASSYASPLLAQDRVSLGEGIIGRVFASGRTELIEDVESSKDYVCWYADTKSEIAVAIQIGGVIEGVLNVESDQISGFTPSDRLVLETVAYQMAIAIENARLFGMVREREDRYRTLVESSPGAVFHLDTGGRLIYANPAATRMTGHDKGTLLSRFGALSELAVADDREALDRAITDALRGDPQRDLEFHINHPDGGQRFLRAWFQPLLGDQGESNGVVVLARDQTRESQLQDQLNQSEKLSAIGTLVSGVAHELNNPLAGILGFAQLLLARPTEDWGRGDIENIEVSARRCQRIVENLLAFARQGRMTKRRSNVNEVIDSVLNLNEYQFRMDNIQVERDFDSTVPPFPIDVHRWQQVFINLASNAHQALLSCASGDRRIRFRTRHLGDRIEIRVSDNGPGISKDKRKLIFDPFFTTKETGTGLGLGICFGIVEEHGGTIALDESVEEGAAFVISLPLADVREQEFPLPSGPRLAASETGAGKRVLVVDDDTYVCEVVSRILSNHGYNAEIVNSGDSALTALAGQSYDLMVTDVRMPGEYDGIDLYDRLVTHDPTCTGRILFMTGNLLDGRTMERLRRLQVRCVEKPFDIHELADVINEVAQSSSDAGLLRLPGAKADAAAS